MSMILKIYDEKGEHIVNTYEARKCDLMFGTIMRFMEFFKIGQIEDTREMLKVVYSSWTEIMSVLNEIFPNVSEEEWKRVKVKDIVPLLINVLKFIASELGSIPKDPN